MPSAVPPPSWPAVARLHAVVRRNPFLLALGFALLYAAAIAAGRASRVDGTQLALMWPAAAVGVLWLGASWGNRRRTALNVLLLAGLAAGTTIVTGSGWGLGAAFAAANVAQSLVCCMVLVRLQRRWGRQPWRLRRPVDLAALVAAAVAGSSAAALVGPLALWLAGLEGSLPVIGAWTLRNATSTVVFSALVLRLADPGVIQRSRTRRDRLELLVVGTVVAVAYIAVFGATTGLPLAFLVLPLSMWVALRFSSTVAAAHVLLVGIFVVGLTLDGHGPFAVSVPLTRVVLAQAFVAVIALVSLVLSLQRDERQELIDQLERTTADARALAAERDAASRAKSAFLATMSHEIRTPLNGVLGLTELLIGSDLPPQQAAWAQAAGRSGRALLTIVNDVLDLSKVESGLVELEEVDLDVLTVVEEALLPVTLMAKEAGLELGVSPAADLVRARRGDPYRLRQIVLNLAANAVKFTERGSVTVTVGGTPDRLVIRIVDTGIGMSAEQLSRLFTPFSQADASTTRRFGGTGLGLAISGGLARQMGGAIEVRSALGVGSSFELDVPLPAARGELLPTQSAPQQQDARDQLRVLIAEDNEINQMVARATLTRLGISVDIVGDGAQAVQAALTGDYDAVLMDCQMPVMDGLEATRRIRASQLGDAQLMVIAMTASALASDREACRLAGMDGFLPKPWTSQQLTDVLQAVRTARAERTKSPTPAA
jgi:signal transduction histidine kinase/CheY-like chemotaxis protein